MSLGSLTVAVMGTAATYSCSRLPFFFLQVASCWLFGHSDKKNHWSSSDLDPTFHLLRQLPALALQRHQLTGDNR